MPERWRALLGDDAVEQRGATIWLTPATVEQASAAVRRANEDRIQLQPAGAGTFIKNRRAVVLSASKLSAIHEYEPADLVLSAEAGAPMLELRAAAARNNQQLALDAPSQPEATIGATVALGAAGPLRQGYGTPRDQVLGLQLVAGSGKVLNLGGKVVKNVAGYDLTRLVIGSRGSLGLITRVNLRISPLPAQDVTFVISGTLPDLCARVSGIRKSTFEPAALEIVGTQTGARLLVRVQGNAEVIAAASAALREAGPLDQLVGPSAFAAWAQLADHELRAGSVLRMGVRPSHLAAALELCAGIAAVGTNGMVAAHAGHGVIRILDMGWKVNGAVAEPLKALQLFVASVRGSLLSERGDWPLVPGSVPSSGVARLNQELKRVFDPNGIMESDE